MSVNLDLFIQENIISFWRCKLKSIMHVLNARKLSLRFELISLHSEKQRDYTGYDIFYSSDN